MVRAQAAAAGRSSGGGGAAAAPAAALFTIREAGAQQPDAGQEPILYAHTLCPYAERAWLALLEKQVPFQLVHVDLSNKPAWFRRVNPRGLVPAVQHGGQVQVESADICRWADGTFSGPRLVPEDGQRAQEMEQLIRGPCGGAVSAGLDLCAGRGRHWGIGSGQSARQRADFEAQLEQLAASLRRHGGPFLLGQQPTLADILVYPFIKRFAVAAPLTGYDVEAALGGAIGGWLAAMDARPSCKATAADSKLLLAALCKHRSLDFFDYVSYAACELHPQNAHLLQR